MDDSFNAKSITREVVTKCMLKVVFMSGSCHLDSLSNVEIVYLLFCFLPCQKKEQIAVEFLY